GTALPNGSPTPSPGLPSATPDGPSTPTGTPGAPSTPATATPSIRAPANLRVLSSGPQPGMYTLTWDAPGNETVTEYRLREVTADGDSRVLTRAPGSQNTIVFRGDPAIGYTVVVVAVDTRGRESALSNPAATSGAPTATPIPPPSPPPGLPPYGGMAGPYGALPPGATAIPPPGYGAPGYLPAGPGYPPPAYVPPPPPFVPTPTPLPPVFYNPVIDPVPTLTPL